MSILNIIKLKQSRGALIALALATPLLSSSVALAQEQPRHVMESTHTAGESGRHMIKKLQHMAKKLDLSPSQVDQIKLIGQQGKIDNSELKPVIKVFKEKNKTLMLEEHFDEQAFIVLYQEYQNTLTQIALVNAKTRHAILQVLSEEQKTKWLSMKEKKKHKRKQN